jgi:DNA modification methylase
MKIDKSSERDLLEQKYEKKIEVNPRLNRKLVSFQANKKVPFYGWFSFKEGFSSQMVKQFINDYPLSSGKVFDPFAGSGTTLFASKELGYDSLGIELLPIGEFVFKSRIAAEQVDINNFKSEIKKISRIDFSRTPIDEEHKIKHLTITKKAFPQETERKLNAYQKYINENISDDNIKQLLKFACFSILEKISYTRKDGQFLRWDYKSKKTKTKFNKGKIYGFEEALKIQLSQILSDISNIDFFQSNNTLEKPRIDLVSGSCLEILPTIDNDSIDFIISSPPYCNRYDYTRTYALELIFLGVDETTIRELRQQLLSCTVENKDKIEYLEGIYKSNNQEKLFTIAEKTFKSTKALQEILEILYEYKENKKLNNPGIYRMVKNYFYEHAFVIFEMERILKKGGRVYYVNDNVRYAGETIPVDLILSEFACKAGLKVRKIYKLKNGKGNSSQQMGAHGREELRKCVYFWEKR